MTSAFRRVVLPLVIGHWSFEHLLLSGLVLTLLTAPVCLAADWPTEKIWVRGGQVYQGLLLSDSKQHYEFAEIVRPRGKSMYAIIRTFPLSDVVRHQRLEAADRAKLIERFDQFRNRALVEAGRMEAVALRQVDREGVSYQVYDGPWFTMLSMADDQTTRRSIVRIEQAICAYRQILPPRIEKGNSFQIYLYGSNAAYQAALARRSIELVHPAFYLPEANLIVAGTNLDEFAVELERVRQENERRKQQLRSLRTSHEQVLAQVSAEMKRNKFSSEEIENEIRARRSAWKAQQEKFEEAIAEADRRNSEQFSKVAGSMFRRLNHEAFHAYLENYVYPQADYDVPRWLNEGLAQVFEHALMDADTLRIDTPAKDLLVKLQNDLRGQKPLKLAELLNQDESLVAAHRDGAETQRRYLYAWGLTYYLTFERSGLSSKQLESYVSRDSAKTPPIKRFERWVGSPLAEFESRWRREMLSLE